MTSRPFAYTNRDYDSLLADLRRRMAIAIPEWTGYDAGFESILLETQAYVGDILNFYIDRMGNEAFLRSATLRESVLNIAGMLGYIPTPQSASVTSVTFTKVTGLNENVTIPAGTQLFAQVEGQAPVFFETQSEITILAVNSTGSVTAVEGLTVSEELIGTSTGAEGQGFVLHFPDVIRDSVRVYTRNGPVDVLGQPTLLEWTYFARLIDANFYDRAFTTTANSDGYTFIIFGDTVSGQIPPVNTEVYSTYRYGAGVEGNVGIGAVRSFREIGALATKIASVTNTTVAAGGTDPETVESMRSSIPRSMQTIERAVSIDDFAALAVRVPGVAKASAVATVSTNINLYILIVGGTAASALPTPTANAIQAYFAGPPSRMVVGTTITLHQATNVPVNITLAITIDPRHRQDTVVDAVTAVITELYAPNNREFGDKLKKADIFHEVVEVPGVDYVDISVFSKTGSGTTDVQLLASEFASLGTLTVTPTGGVVLP